MREHPDPFGWVGHELDGKYRVEHVVGEGGFGVVYRAYHAGLRENVAVKCLKVPPGLGAEQRAKFEETFLEEGRLLHRLSRIHAAIAQALDVGAATSPTGTWTPYLVLEWLEGRSLQEALEERQARGEGAASLEETLALLGPALDALAEAHDQGVAHRDLKPPNLFLAQVGGRIRVKVLDFGIAKVLGDTLTLTRALEETGGSIKAFTPQYGAPEQFDSNHGATGPWTDVFALALLIVEMLTGRPALDGQDTIQLFVAAANPAVRPTPRARGVHVPDAVDTVLARALAVRPRDRYLTAGAFADALRDAAARSPGSPSLVASQDTVLAVPPLASPSTQIAPPSVEALQASAPSYCQASTTSPQVGPIPAAPAPSRPSRSPLFFALVAAVPVAVVALGVTTWLALRAPKPSAEPTPPLPSASTAPSAPVSSSPPEPEMVRVPPGTFEMGSDKGARSERPAHQVTISRAFFIDRTEVTVSEYLVCVRAGACSSPGLHGPGTTPELLATKGKQCNAFDPARARHPVNCVDRVQAEKYCRFAGKRLPSEAEWEYAARGTSRSTFPWGSTPPTCDRAAVDRGAAGTCRLAGDRTEPVGSVAGDASRFGLLDMGGNVREWVSDGFDDRAYARGGVTDPQVRLTISRKAITRGGAWNSSVADAVAWRRIPSDRAVGDLSTGFRCARSAD